MANPDRMHRSGRGLRQSWLLRECAGEQREHEAHAAIGRENAADDGVTIHHRHRLCFGPSVLQQRDCVGVGSLACAPATYGGARRATQEATWSLLRSGALLKYERPKEGARIAMALDALVFALSLTVVSLFLSLVL